MIKKDRTNAKVMEFTSFKKKENVTDDELIQAVIQFENSFLANQEGILFHCLVRNFNNEYANVLFADNMDTINNLFKEAENNDSTKHFFSLIEDESVKITIHQIEKENFRVPTHFSCIEHGTFSLKDNNDYKNLINVSNTIEKEYLNKLENTKAHFIGTVSDNLYSEITFGETLGKTKEACFGYMENNFCKPLLEMADETSMKLDFWYLIA
ncbi:hypothetical protein [Tenacibaculum retecalamus]|uniref:hypothetical protein n=1 Tax=Tenacibaculum retecalamus TaxID=3018315 RepID=UPI0023D95E3D|nr:hypothetical protein [Tenacibaculum retecalamus]WBX71178.1 hypothetical protein PG912_13370 [Tenacibaculum retecalamus]